MKIATAALGAALTAACALGAATPSAAQSTTMQGFSMNKGEPVRIESNTLEVRDKQKQATFIGDVKMTQGDTVLKCKVLVVFYEDPPPKTQAQKKGPAADTKKESGQGSQQIKRAECKGDVFVTQRDQTASGDQGVYDLKANTVRMTGNVVVTQGSSVLRGEIMTVDLASGVTRVEASKTGRVEMLTQPGAKDAKQGPLGGPPAAQAAPPAKAPQKGPIRIN